MGRKKCLVLAYADDLTMLTKTEEDMRGMVSRRYLERNGLVLNALKSKKMVFRKGGRVMDYLWKGDTGTVMKWKYIDMGLRSSAAIPVYIF